MKTKTNKKRKHTLPIGHELRNTLLYCFMNHYEGVCVIYTTGFRVTKTGDLIDVYVTSHHPGMIIGKAGHEIDSLADLMKSNVSDYGLTFNKIHLSEPTFFNYRVN